MDSEPSVVSTWLNIVGGWNELLQERSMYLALNRGYRFAHTASLTILFLCGILEMTPEIETWGTNAFLYTWSISLAHQSSNESWMDRRHLIENREIKQLMTSVHS